MDEDTAKPCSYIGEFMCTERGAKLSPGPVTNMHRSDFPAEPMPGYLAWCVQAYMYVS